MCIFDKEKPGTIVAISYIYFFRERNYINALNEFYAGGSDLLKVS